MRNEVCCRMVVPGATVASIFRGPTAHRSKSLLWVCRARSQQLVMRLASARSVGLRV